MTSPRLVLATSDPVFAALCRRAFEAASLQLIAAVAPAELLETLRQVSPDLLVLDVDSDDVAAMKLLAAKVMLVSDARVVLVSAYLAPGSPGLGALLQSIAATFAQKPQGASSLGLADDDGPAFAVALQIAFAAHEGEDLAGRPLAAPAAVAAAAVALAAPAVAGRSAEATDHADAADADTLIAPAAEVDEAWGDEPTDAGSGAPSRGEP